MLSRDAQRWCRRLILPMLFVAAGCARPAPDPIVTSSEGAALEPAVPGVSSGVTGIVVLGDSLTAGLGLLLEDSFPSRLQDLFTDEGYHEVDILNAGVSGDTTAGGLRRIPELLTADTRIVVVALGGNDALRGLSVDQTRQNLVGIIDLALNHGAAVMLVGMEGPTNLGEDYRTNFRNTFRDIADQYRGRIRFVPFLLEGVAGMRNLNQPDGIHPNEAGARVVADHLYPSLRDMVDEIPIGPVVE